MSTEMMELFGFSFVTRISGGEIISHNADRVESGTAIWETAKLIKVTLTEAASFDPAMVAPQEATRSGEGAGPSLATLLNAIEQNPKNASAQTTSESAEPTTETSQAETAEPADALVPRNDSG